MAYRAKYRYRWTSQNGNEGEVLLLKDGYTGAVIDRPLGRAPELSMEQNGHIHGTSLVLYLECREDGEYTELYTSSAKEWQVQLWWNGRSLWTGYLTPELYSEPDIAPPYDVCVTATDGLGELKRSEYKPASWDLSLEDHLYGILALTGLDQTIYHTGGISADGRPGASMLHEVKVDLSHFQGKTCYDVLDGILTAINAELTTWGQQWMLLRPSDLDNTSANLALYPANGGGSQTWSIPSYGSARTHGRWPVGQMSTQIIAARSAVTVQSPNHLREGSELNPDGWSGSGSSAIRVEAGATSASGELITEGHWELMAGGSIAQSVKYSKGLGAHTLRIDQYGMSKVRITYRTSSGSAVHVLGMANGQVGWDMGGGILIGSKTRETLEIPIPAWAGAGTLTVSIAQYNIVSPITAVYGVSFAVNGVSYGLELRLDLSNGARSEADAVESAFSTYPGGDETYDVLLSQSGLPSFGGSPVSRWSTTKLGSQSYIGLLAMDIALGCALPRARKTGKLNVPQGADPTFLLLSDGSRNYFVNTYTVDLLEDEVSVDMTSLPAAELSVEGETYRSMIGGGSASYASGSSGGQALPGYTVLSYDEAVALSEDPGNRTIPSAWALKTHISDGVKHITSTERTKWNKVVSDFAAITGNDADSVINKWEEVVAFLDTYTEADTLANLLSNKVDKVSGKGLSTNDFTDALLTKLNGIEAGANKYIHPTHSAVTIASADGRVLGSISVDLLGHVTSVGYKALGFADLPSLYIGKTKVQSSSAAQTLTGISSLTLEGSTAELKWDDDKSAWRLSGNLLVDGFIASGGTGSSGGSSGGAVDVSYVANLTAGTLLGTLTINGTDYQILAPSLTASSINAALGNTPVARASADAEGNSISGTYAKTSALPTKVSQLTNDSGYITGITKAMVESVLTGGITSHTHLYAGSATAGGAANSANSVEYVNKIDTNYGNCVYFLQSHTQSTFPHPGWFSTIKMLYNNSTGYFTEIATSFSGEDGMWRRSLRGGTQQGWFKMLDSGNYSAYSPTLTGTGATGTWGINISGNAASSAQSPLLSNTSDAKAVSGVYFHRTPNAVSLVGNTEANGVWGQPSESQDKSFGNASILRMGWSSGYYTDIFTGPNLAAGKYGLQWRQIVNNTAYDWRTILDSSNLNSYAPKLDGAGATGTWGISISGNAATATHIPPSSYAPSGNTVGEHKEALLNAIQQQGLGIGDNITVNAAVIRKWHNDSATVESSSVYSMIKIGGGYSKSTHGQWLLSSYSDSNPLIIGRNYGSWTDIRTLAFITDNVASATKLATARTLWGQSFDGTGNVSGALTGVTSLTASGKVQASSLTLDGTNLLEWDESNSAWKFNGNLIATGFIASGDLSAQAAALAEEEDRIAALEAQVAELQAEIENLKAA